MTFDRRAIRTLAIGLVAAAIALAIDFVLRLAGYGLHELLAP